MFAFHVGASRSFLQLSNLQLCVSSPVAVCVSCHLTIVDCQLQRDQSVSRSTTRRKEITRTRFRRLFFAHTRLWIIAIDHEHASAFLRASNGKATGMCARRLEQNSTQINEHRTLFPNDCCGSRTKGMHNEQKTSNDGAAKWSNGYRIGQGGHGRPVNNFLFVHISLAPNGKRPPILLISPHHFFLHFSCAIAMPAPATKSINCRFHFSHCLAHDLYREILSMPTQ